jgi:hypothetical protein
MPAISPAPPIPLQVLRAVVLVVAVPLLTAVHTVWHTRIHTVLSAHITHTTDLYRPGTTGRAHCVLRCLTHCLLCCLLHCLLHCLAHCWSGCHRTCWVAVGGGLCSTSPAGSAQQACSAFSRRVTAGGQRSTVSREGTCRSRQWGLQPQGPVAPAAPGDLQPPGPASGRAGLQPSL